MSSDNNMSIAASEESEGDDSVYITEVDLLDRGIVSISKEADLCKYPHLRSLNVHSNRIREIDGLGDIPSLSAGLVSLNLSSNMIERIQGLEFLRSLKYLNLASNRLSQVEGLGECVALRTLVLAYNRITDISGLKAFHGFSTSLARIDLRGNLISTLKHLSILAGIPTLHIVLLQDSDGGLSNPVCSDSRYEEEVQKVLEHVKYVDNSPAGMDGRVSVDLEKYREYIAFSDVTSEIGSNAGSELQTPRIDRMLHQFKQKGKTAVPSKEEEEKPSTRPSKKKGNVRVDDQKNVEHVKKAPKPPRNVERRKKEEKKNVEKEEGTDRLLDDETKILEGLEREKQYRQQLDDSREKLEKMESRALKAELALQRVTRRAEEQQKQMRNSLDDRDRRLADERKRRKVMEGQFKEVKGFLLEREEVIRKVRSENLILENDNHGKSADLENGETLSKEVQQECNDLRDKISVLRREGERNEEDLKVLRDRVKELEDSLSKSKDAEYRSEMEASMCKETLDREKERWERERNDMKIKFSDEFRSLLARQEEATRRVQESSTAEYESKMKELVHQMKMKEEQSEQKEKAWNSSFNELKKAFEESTKTSSELKQVLRHTVQKEIRSTAMVSELTDVVKEQREKLQKLNEEKRNMEDYLVSMKNESNAELWRHLEVQKERDADEIHGLEEVHGRLKQKYEDMLTKACVEKGELKAEVVALTRELESRNQKDIEYRKKNILTDQLKEEMDVLARRLREKDNAYIQFEAAKRRESVQLEEELRLKEEKCKVIEEQLGKKEDEYHELEETVHDLEDKVERLRHQRSSFQEQLEEKEEMVTYVQKEVARIQSLFEQKESALRSEANQLKEENKALQVSVEKANAGNVNMKQQHDSEKEQLLARIKQAESLQNDLQKQQAQKDAEMRMLLQALERQKASHEDKMRRLYATFSEISQDPALRRK